MSDGRDSSKRMAGYYSYLFTFPSMSAMVTAIAAISTSVCLLSFAIVWGVSTMVKGLIYGSLGLALPLLISDVLVQPIFWEDAFVNLRRLTIMTYVSTIIYAIVVLFSSVASAATGIPDIIQRGVVMAVAIIASLRYLCIRVLTTNGPLRYLIAAFLQPVLCLAAAHLLLPINGTRMLVLSVSATVILVGGAQTLLWVLMRWEGDSTELKLIHMFRAFVLAWAEEMNEPLEEQITRLGEVRKLSVDSIVFGCEAGECNAALIVPYIHPGPFRNVGSSNLPGILADRIGQKFNCETLIAHGISTHEVDLTSSNYNEEVAQSILSDIPHSKDLAFASQLVWSESDGAAASCQLFGNVALTTLSLHPKNYDDLPEEVAERIFNAAREFDLTAVVVDSHHSIRLDDELDEYNVENIFQAAIKALLRAHEMQKHDFSVGAARIIPSEWSIEDGMGPCGIAALTIRLGNGQTSAYIVIDGNNMLSGLRERIIEAVRARGIDEAEVMTSDTHIVNAIGATGGGYFPIGTRTDSQKIIDYSVEAVEKALSRALSKRASHVRTEIDGLKVLGSKGLDVLSHVLESGFYLFKKAGLIIAPIALFLAAAVVYLL